MDGNVPHSIDLSINIPKGDKPASEEYDDRDDGDIVSGSWLTDHAALRREY